MPRSVPNIRHLRAFREVARSRSISTASTRVHLSQPAITQAIAKLEAQLGVTLFERRSDGMFPTEPGELFLNRVGRALDTIRAGAREAVRLGARRGARGFAEFGNLLTTAQLRALVAMSRAGNFSLAARSVGVSQPTLHRAARDLERLTGLPLFEKTGQGIELSRAAEAMAQNVKLAFAELEQGFDELDRWLGTDTGRIVVGTLPLARTFILPWAINALLRDRPEVRISVIDGPYGDLLHGLRHGDIDMMIGALRDPVPIDDVVQEPLLDDLVAVVGRAGHPLAGRTDISVADLARHPWVVPRPETPTRRFFEALFRDAGLAGPTNVVESSSLVLIRGLLLDSDRLTMISTHQIRNEAQLGLLAPLPLATGRTRRPIGLTLRRDWRPTATQVRFLDLLREAGRRAQSD